MFLAQTVFFIKFFMLFNLRQSFNIAPLYPLWRQFKKRAVDLQSGELEGGFKGACRLLVPHVEANNIESIDWNRLRREFNISAVVFDKDNTLALPYSKAPADTVKHALEDAKQSFPKFGSFAILSNSVGTPDCSKYEATETEQAFGMPVIRHSQKKPECLAEVLKHFEQFEDLKHIVRPGTICVIGDRVLTDVLFANSNGMVSVLVRPLTYNPLKDNAIAAIIRCSSCAAK